MINIIEKIIFLSIIFFLPTQLGKHFWPPFSFIGGLRIDYLSPTLYVTDILILSLLLIFISNRLAPFILKISNLKRIIRRYWLLVVLAPMIIGGGIYFSTSPLAGLYKLLKILEFSFFGIYIATRPSLKKDFSSILTLFSVGVFFESILATAQFLQQSSIGGFLWFLGERTFSGQTPGIASASIDGRLLLRPYGTFSHPNVLAAYLLVMMTLIYDVRFKIYDLRKFISIIAVVVGTIALVLTLSRVAILLWFLFLVWVAFRSAKQMIQNEKLQITNYKLLIGLLVVLAPMIIGGGIIVNTPLSSRFTSLLDVDRESFLRRQELNSAAIEMFRTSPFFGVGLNNFLVRLPEFSLPTSGPLWLQPVHNMYLLIIAETGIIGLLLFLWFIGKTYLRIKDRHSLFIIFSMVLFLGLFDHYFLTLQQGQLLFSFIAGLVFARKD